MITTSDTYTMERAVENFAQTGLQMAAEAEPGDCVVMHIDRDHIFELCIAMLKLLRDRPKPS